MDKGTGTLPAAAQTFGAGIANGSVDAFQSMRFQGSAWISSKRTVGDSASRGLVRFSYRDAK